MKLVLQRVSEASVTVENQVIGAIKKGLLVFLGIHKNDTMDRIPWYVSKLVQLRIFEDEEGKMNRSLKDVNGEVLVVSQFTLYGNCLNGRRPDFIQAAPPAIAIPLYEEFIRQLRQEISSIQTGEFGANMKVSLINDGPVTFILE